MTGVVLRCPNCGTVQAGTGECDACHEGEVRYFCTNHTPGRWLDARGCDLCGARFGEVAPEPRTVPASTQLPLQEPPPSPPTARSGRSPWADPIPEPDAFSAGGDYAEPDLALERLRELVEGEEDDRGAGTEEPRDYGTEPGRMPGRGCGKIVLALILAALFLVIVGPLLVGTIFLRLFM
jgi:hypothetical protein